MQTQGAPSIAREFKAGSRRRIVATLTMCRKPETRAMPWVNFRTALGHGLLSGRLGLSCGAQRYFASMRATIKRYWPHIFARRSSEIGVNSCDTLPRIFHVDRDCHMKHSIFHPAWQGVLAVSLMLFVVPVSYADDGPPTAEQCLDAFMQSPAAPSCESGTGQTDVAVSSEGLCEITDTCPTREGQPQRSSITVSVEHAVFVSNCNGRLQPGDCAE